jgi:hypothetical protein
MSKGKTNAAATRASNQALRVIVVLGMHRSGTSAITRALQTMSVELGESLMPPNPDVNARGFWEDLDINALNNQMLQTVGSDWHRLAALTKTQLESLRAAGFVMHAVELLRAKTASAPVFGFKDPRTCKLLPIWQEALALCDLAAGYVIAVRHPMSVADSLAARDGFHRTKSYLLWLEHTLLSLRSTQGCARVLIDYDALIADPDREVSRMSKTFALGVDSAELESFKKNFLSENLRHASHPVEEIEWDGLCPPKVREVFLAIADLVKRRTSLDAPAFQGRLEEWLSYLHDLGPVAHLLDESETQTTAASLELGKREQQLAETERRNVDLSAAVHERNRESGDLHATVAQKVAEISGLHQVIADRERHIAELERIRAQLAQETAGVQQALAVQCVHLQHVEAALALQQADSNRLAETGKQVVEGLRRTLSERDSVSTKQSEEITRLNIEVVERTARIDLLQQSFSLAERELTRISAESDRRQSELQEVLLLRANDASELGSLKHSLSVYEARVADLIAAMTEKQKELYALTVALETSRAETQKLSEKAEGIAQLQHTSGEKDSIITRHAEAVARLNVEVVERAARIDLLQQSLSAAERELTRISVESNRKQSELQEVLLLRAEDVNELGSMRRSCSVYEARLADLNVAVAEKQKALHALTVSLESSRSENEKLRERARGMEEVRNSLSAREQELGRTLHQLKRARIELNEVVAQRVGDAAKLASLEQALAAHESRRQELAAAIADKQEQVRVLSVSVQTGRGENEKLASELLSARDAVAKLLKQQESLEDMASHARKRVTVVERALDAAQRHRVTVEDMVLAKSSEVMHVREQVTARERELTSLQDHLSKSYRQLEHRRGQDDETSKVIQSLQESLKDRAAAAARYQTMVRDQEAELASLFKKAADLRAQLDAIRNTRLWRWTSSLGLSA